MANIEIKRFLLRYRVASVSTLILGIALSTFAFVAADSRERSAVRRAFDDAAANVSAAITHGVQDGIDQVEAIGALFDSANDTSHAQFDSFALQHLARSHGIQALEWIPRVPSAMRVSYEKAMQEAVPGFEITERKAQGQMIRAGKREEYFPVYLMEPEERNRAAIGFDLGSEPARIEALTRARDTGKVAATARITLVQETDTQYGFLLFRPVYRSGLPRDTDEQRHNNLLGFALGVFRAGDLIEATAAHLQSSGIRAVIYDDSAPTPERFLAIWPAMRQDEVLPADQAVAQSELQRTDSLSIGGRSWRIVLTPTEQFFATMPYRPVWMPFLVGSLLTLLLVAYIEAAKKHLRKELESRETRLASEAKLTNILGSIDSILMSIVPGSGELVYANRAAERIFGQSRAEFNENRKLWLEAIHPDDRRRIYKHLSLPLEKGSWSDEFRILRFGGEGRWLGAKAKALLDAKGKPERIDIVGSDITEQRQAEEKLRQSEEKFKSLFNAAADAILIRRMDGRYVEVNQAAVDRLGYSREELLTMTPADIETPEVAARLSARFAEVARTGDMIAEIANLRKDGSVVPGEVHAKIIDYEGSPAVLAVLRDTTERKKAEEKIRQAEQRYRTLFEQAPLGIVIRDFDSGLAIEFNDIAHDQLGYSREEFARLKVNDYEALERPDETRAHLDKVLRRGTDAFDTQHRTKSGALRDVHVMLRALELANSRQLYCIFQDITEKRKGEIALQKANRALRALSAANEKLVHATSEEELLQDVCRIVVEIGAYRMVGICYAQNDPEKTIKPMNWAGAEECCIAEEIQTWADTEDGQMPVSRTIRSGRPELARDIQNDPAFARWREAAVERGYASILALPLSDGARTFGGLCVYSAEPDAFDTEEIRLLGELAGDLSYGVTTLRSKAERERLAYEHQHHEEILRKSLEESIQAIADTVEMRDPYTAGHQRRVGELAVAIAQELGLPEDTVHGIRLAASVHDLGKITVPAEILAKPGKLTEIELLLTKAHAQAGYEILKDIEFPWPLATIVWQHHERLDGSGYPHGIKNGEILLESRIMAVADVVEAMASHRPYRASLGMDAALAEIERGRDSAYDPAVVDACLKVVREGRFAFAN